MKTLFLDIETSPNLVLSWGIGKQYLTFSNIVKERQIICVSYKWAGEKTVHHLDWGKNQDDKKLLIAISKVMVEADEIVAHNGDAFDLKWINGRLLFHNLPPIGPTNSTDTYKMAARVFYLNCFKLDYLSQYLKIGKKVDTGGYSLWKEIVLDHNAESLKKMISYCDNDVILLENVYNKIVKYNPEMNKGRAINGHDLSCRNCGRQHIIKFGTCITKEGRRYQKYRCEDCGAVFRSKVQIKKEVKK